MLFLQSTEEKYFINNHLSFRVMYHKDSETDSARIVGFEVTPTRYHTFFTILVSYKLFKIVFLVGSYLSL